MRKAGAKVKVLGLTTLAAALIGAYGSVYAEALVLTDGDTHIVSDAAYDYVESNSKAGAKTIPTALTATGLTIEDNRQNHNKGAVFSKGGTIAITDSTISTSGDKGLGLHAFSQRQGEAATNVTASRLGIATAGNGSHGVFLYVERKSGDRADTMLTLSDSRVVTTGDGSNAMIVGGVGDASLAGNNRLDGDGLTLETSGTNSVGLKAQFLGNAELSNSSITTTGVAGHGLYATGGSSIAVSDSTITTSGQDAAGAVIENSGAISLTNVEMSTAGASFHTAMYEATANQSIQFLGADSVATNNNGVLLQVVRTADGQSGNLNFVLGADTVTQGDVRDTGVALADRSGRVAFSLGERARWTGALEGLDAATISAGAHFTETGGQFQSSALTVGDGARIAFENGVILNQSFIAKGGTQANFAGPTTISGPVRATGPGSSIVLGDDTSVISTAGTYGVQADAGGIVHLNGATVTNNNSALETYGITATGTGSTITGNGASIQADGTSTSSASLVVAARALSGSTIDLTGGTVKATGGRHTRAILAGGGVVTTSGTAISTAGANSHAAHATGVDSAIDIHGGTVDTEGDESSGLYAQNGGLITSSSTVTTSGKAGFGAFAYNGGRIILNGGALNTSGIALNGTVGTFGVLSKTNSTVVLNGTQVTTAGSLADGLRVEDGASITANNSTIITSGAKAHGVAAYTGGSADLIGGSVLATGSGYGLYATGDGSQITTSGGTAITTNGGKYGVYADAGGVIELNGGSVTNTNTAAGSQGIAANGLGSRIEASNVAISTAGEYIGPGELAVGVAASNDAHIELLGGSIAPVSTQFSRGILASTRATVAATGVVITTAGVKSNAVHAFSNRTTDDKPVDTPTITLNGGSISTAQADSYGFSSQNIGAAIDASNLSVVTAGANSYGAVAYNGGRLGLNNVRLATQGDGAVGIALNAMSAAQVPGSVPIAHNSSSVTMQGGSITTSGADAAGVLLRNDAELILNGVTVNASGPALASEFTKTGQTQNLTIGAGSNLESASDVLLSVNRNGAGLDGIVNFKLGSGAFASGNIVNYLDGVMTASNEPGLTQTNFEAGSHWAGIFINSNTHIVDSSAPVSGPQAGDVASVRGSNVAFVGVPSIAGSVSGAVGSTLMFSGGAPTVITENLVGQQGSTINFSNSATINQSVTGVGSTMNFGGGSTTITQGIAGSGSTISFGGAATIGQSLTGASNSVFSFSQTAPTIVNGAINLSGGSTIQGGSVSSPIMITGNTSVSSGAVLGGNLNVAGQLSGVGGTLGPGNSTGIQTYGSLGAFSGTYLAEVNSAGQSDLIRITGGSADLRAIALLVGQENGNGGYVLNHDYTILETGDANGVGIVPDNKFSTEGLDSSFAGTLVKLDPAKYGANNVRISLSLDQDKANSLLPSLSSNQRAVLGGVISVMGQNTAADAALQSQDPAGALNQLSGELHGSTQSALLNNSSLITRTLSSRMRGNLGAGMQAGAPLAQSSGSIPAGAMPRSAAYPLWAEVVGSWSSLDDDGNAAKVDSNVAGLFIGGDTPVGNGWRLGGALGFTDGKIKANDRSSKSDVTSYTAALYGGNSWAASSGKVNFLAGAAYTRHNVDSRRMVTVGGSQTLKADYHVNTTQLFTELGYAIPMGRASEVEPYLGVAWLSQKAKGFTESGGAAALRGDQQKDDVTSFTLGLRGKTTVDVGANQASLLAGLGWRHAAGDVDSSRRMSFIQGNGSAFRVAGAPIAKNAAVVDLGAEMGVGKNANLGLSYSGQFGNGNTDNTGSLYLKVRF